MEKDKIYYAYRIPGQTESSMFLNDNQWVDSVPADTNFDFWQETKKDSWIIGGQEMIYIGIFRGPIHNKINNSPKPKYNEICF